MAASLIVLAFYLYTVYAIIGKQKKGKGAAKPISRPPASAMHAMRLKVLEIMRHPTCKARPHNADSKRHDAYWNARPPALTLPPTASALARETTTAPAPPRRTAASVPSHARRWRHEHDVAALSIKGARALCSTSQTSSATSCARPPSCHVTSAGAARDTIFGQGKVPSRRGGVFERGRTGGDKEREEREVKDKKEKGEKMRVGPYCHVSVQCKLRSVWTCMKAEIKFKDQK